MQRPELAAAAGAAGSSGSLPKHEAEAEVVRIQRLPHTTAAAVLAGLGTSSQRRDRERSRVTAAAAVSRRTKRVCLTMSAGKSCLPRCTRQDTRLLQVFEQMSVACRRACLTLTCVDSFFSPRETVVVLRTTFCVWTVLSPDLTLLVRSSSRDSCEAEAICDLDSNLDDEDSSADVMPWSRSERRD